MNLHVEDHQEDKYGILKLSGEIDAYTAPQLKEKLLTLVEEKESVEVDLTKVSYMDSTGLGVFISALKLSKEKDHNFKLINLQENVYRLFNITGLNEVINIENTIEGELS
ncbi:STAS domain-containing protein [Alkalibacillus haloalkaliphilus]|uniref:Anti-sigma factor antagonist n=1 Tax=Alkalibacillus haloalkaliphilus TaxID=94136 RepID=A0A511W7T4_9BACI|nr:STAS domain-containing protein [Alkalibacillus haloalkaliphilus]MDV2583379.1 STAS domain-containing protein [Alkalibacillus haloalkaliphilus]GEN47150.1 anti-sigma-B factor antagonist [Alkalibacillus haloalkaliphilus]